MKYKELEWTVCFDFPEQMVYPTEPSGFQAKLDPNVKAWNNKAEANEFGKLHADKYSYTVVPIVIETEIE